MSEDKLSRRDFFRIPLGGAAVVAVNALSPLATIKAQGDGKNENNNEIVLSRTLQLMTRLGMDNPTFSDSIKSGNIDHRHINNSSYLLGDLGYKGKDFVSYCAPIAISSEISILKPSINVLDIANTIVRDLGSQSSNRIINTLGGHSEADFQIGGIDFKVNQLQMGVQSMQNVLGSTTVETSKVLVMRNINDNNSVGHLINIQKNGDNNFSVVQSNVASGVFFRDSTAIAQADAAGASRGGIFVSTGSLEDISRFIDRTARWYSSNTMAQMIIV